MKDIKTHQIFRQTLTFDQLQEEVAQLEQDVSRDTRLLKEAKAELQQRCEDEDTHEFDFDEGGLCMHCGMQYLGDPTDSLEQG